MKKVLIIEDDQRITLALGIRLKAMGYQVESAPDAVNAISQARESQPDIILLDIGLPAGDGFVVADRLRQLNLAAITAIIFMTASKKSGLRERALEAGAVGFLEKPFDVLELAEAMERAVTRVDDLAPIALEI